MTGLQFHVCYVIKTRVEFGIVEITRFVNYLRNSHLLFKIVINLKILENSQEYFLENSQEYVFSEVICL